MTNLDEWKVIKDQPDVKQHESTQCNYGGSFSKPTFVLSNIDLSDLTQPCAHPQWQ